VDLALIRQAFETRLDTWATANSVSIAWENHEFEPVADQVYAEARLLPARTKDLFMDQTGRDYTGIFQVNLSMPLGTGAAAAMTLIDSLDDAFPGSFTQGGIRVTLISPMSPAPALPVPDRYVVPVSTEYRVVTVT
jgi:hypothetical protein